MGEKYLGNVAEVAALNGVRNFIVESTTNGIKKIPIDIFKKGIYKDLPIDSALSDTSENAVKNKVIKSALDAKANSIISTSSGTVFHETDCAAVPPINIKLFGKSTQNQYEGNQLFDVSKFPTTTIGNVTLTNNGDGSLTISGNGNLTERFEVSYSLTHEETVKLFKAGVLYSKFGAVTYPYFSIELRYSGGSYGGVFNLSGADGRFNITQQMLDDESTYFKLTLYGGSGEPIIPATFKPMIYQDGAGTWEQYTGGQAAPSINYPQKAEFLGESGSIGGKVLTGNLFGDVSYFESQGFIQNGDYWEGSGNHRLLYTNYKGINGSLVIEYDYMSLANINTFIMEIHYTDGTQDLIGKWKQNEWVHNRIVTNLNKTVDYINRTFADRGNFYVKNFMISTDGKPYDPYTEQPFTFQTPNGLRGIPLGTTIPDAIKNSPIHMSGVYWDSVEQKYYIADTKNDDGKDVQRIEEYVADANNGIQPYEYGKGFLIANLLSNVSNFRGALCNQLRVAHDYVEASSGTNMLRLGVNNTNLYLFNNSFYDETLEDKGLANFKAHLNENPLKIWTWLEEPIVTESDARYDVVMNYPNTTVVNDEGAYQEVTYIADTKNYIAKIEKKHEEDIQTLKNAILSLGGNI